MPIIEDMMLRKGLALLAFAAVFLLTPRAWVDADAPAPPYMGTDIEVVPVHTLHGTEECLWCETMQPVDCDVIPTSEDDREDTAPSLDKESAERIWLNPDAPPPSSETTRPCPSPTPKGERPNA